MVTARALVLVVIAGPQASGKSTVASALGDALRRQDERVAVVELDAVAAMALPTLPSWDAAHSIFEAVTGLWARAGLTCVIAEGSGSHAEVARLVQQAPPGAATLIVATTTGFDTAYARAQADPSRVVSREHGFLRGVYDRWPDELDGISPDVLLDTTRLDVGQSVAKVLEEISRRRQDGPAADHSG